MKLKIIILNNNNKKPGIKEYILRDCVLIGKTNVWWKNENSCLGVRGGRGTTDQEGAQDNFSVWRERLFLDRGIGQMGVRICQTYWTEYLRFVYFTVSKLYL